MSPFIAITAEQIGTVIGSLISVGIWVALLVWIVKRIKKKSQPPPLQAAQARSLISTAARPAISAQLTQEEQDERLTRILKRVRRIELLTRGLVKETLGGKYHSRFKGQGIEFDDFREYQPGDDVRFLDWNVTARMDSPWLRKYIEERELTVMLLVDVSGSGDYGSKEDSKRELAAELAAVFAFSAIANQDKVGLVLFSDGVEAYVPPRKGLPHTLRLVRDILNFEPQSPRSGLQPALDIALQRVAHRSLIVIVSDFLLPDQSWEHAMRAVAAKHEVAAVTLTDPAELVLPEVGRVCLRDPETGEERIVNTSSASVRKHYAQRLAAHRLGVESILRRCGVETVPVVAGESPVPALKAYFQARKRKKR